MIVNCRRNDGRRQLMEKDNLGPNAVEVLNRIDRFKVPRHMKFIDRGENMIRLPTMYNTDKKKDKKKFFKNSRRRIIQKIIKKNRQKTTVPPESYDIVQDEVSPWKDEPTTRRYYKKKYVAKVARYPMPYQRLQKMRSHNKREKRDTYKDSFYKLKDFN